MYDCSGMNKMISKGVPIEFDLLSDSEGIDIPAIPNLGDLKHQNVS